MPPAPPPTQFMEQATITSVAQTVVDKVVRLHHDMFLTHQNRMAGRDDITLVIRNFSNRWAGAAVTHLVALAMRLFCRAWGSERDGRCGSN